MYEVIALFRLLVEVCASAGPTVRRTLAQPVLTVCLMTVVYGGMHVLREESLSGGLRVAFLDSEASRDARKRELENAMMQAELRQFTKSNRLIEKSLETLLERAAGAARVRLDVFHNGVIGITGNGLLRYDVTNTAAAPGHSSGPLVHNQPLSDWGSVLPALLAGRWQMVRTEEFKSASVRARFEAMGASISLLCPVADVQGKLAGALIVSWDAGNAPPSGVELQSLATSVQHIGGQIAAVLDLRGASGWSGGRASGD
ncbi:MAG TPA: hypothetical protein VN702_16350 [Acetobacteraceae bacterium]|nr:hypothetical protein [Acetobacteraceae bacterium]